MCFRHREKFGEREERVKHRFEVDWRKNDSALCATREKKKKKGNFSFAQDIYTKKIN